MSHLPPTSLSSIPPKVLNTVPALPPPAGLKSNFIKPEDRGYKCNAVVTVLFCFMACLFANRVYTKLFIVRKTGLDDVTCTIAFVGSVAMYIVTLWSTIRGPVGKHQWDVKLVDAISGNFVTTSAILVFLSPLTLLFAKLTFFFLYLQVFWLLKWLRISVYVGATLNCAFYGAISIVQVVFLTPRHGETWLQHSLSQASHKVSVLSIYLAAVGLAFDLGLLIMPIAAVMELQLPKQRKMGVLFIFFIGIFACVGSALSVYYRVLNQRTPDITWNIMPVRLLSLLEILIGISCACMPAFSKMLQHHRPALERFRSALSKYLRFWRSEKAGDATIGLDFSHVRNLRHESVAETIQGSRSQLEAGLSSPMGRELDRIQSTQFYGGGGWSKDAWDDNIHFTREAED